jgi:hypothetical protein
MIDLTGGRPGRGRLAAVAIAGLLGVAGCGSAVPPATSSPPAPPSSDRWQVADIDQPNAVLDPPSLEPGYQCHPCHYLAENELFDVADTPLGPIAVGVQQPPAEAIAFTSSDLHHWTPLAGFEGADGTSGQGIAANGKLIVIVGQGPAGATSWAQDGAGWLQAPEQDDLAVAHGGGAMTAVTPFGDEFVAGGYRDDPERGTKAAAAWRSRDGLTWRADEAGNAFAGGRILDLVATDDTIVAVGTNGDPTYGPAAAWRWTHEDGWRRAQLRPNDGGAMRSVARLGGRFVAVGTNDDDHGAGVWT